MWDEWILAHFPLFIASFCGYPFSHSFDPQRTRRPASWAQILPRFSSRTSRISAARSPTESPCPSPSLTYPIGRPILARRRDVSCFTTTVADLPPHTASHRLLPLRLCPFRPGTSRSEGFARSHSQPSDSQHYRRTTFHCARPHYHEPAERFCTYPTSSYTRVEPRNTSQAAAPTRCARARSQIEVEGTYSGRTAHTDFSLDGDNFFRHPHCVSPLKGIWRLPHVVINRTPDNQRPPPRYLCLA